MEIVSIGGGPAGLYFGILMKKLDPSCRVRVFERNRRDDTFGWGVVFSDETLGNVRAADPESFAEIERNFVHWTDIENHFKQEVVVSTGHGFSGLARKKLLQILQDRAESLGVELHFETEVSDLGQFKDADLILGADGVNSRIREAHADVFKPEVDWRHCRFCWLGTDKPLDAFTFIFKENEHGLFQVHAYPFQDGLSTWIVECHEPTWKAAGLDKATEEETVAYCERLFADDLGGHKLLTNRSIWRRFPTVKCEQWSKDNLILMGDAAHTAHFSIGSGTKLAMEDAIILRDAFASEPGISVKAALARYEEMRRLDVIKTQKAAQTSLEWFENAERYMGQDPVPFAFNLMTRSKQITFDNLRLRDPKLVDETAEAFAQKRDLPKSSDGSTPPPAYSPILVGGLELKNRIVVSPMCQYMAKDGVPNDWHLVHLGSRAVGGAGLILTEMTDVLADGRITPGCAGLWNDEQTTAWRRITDYVHEHTPSAIGIQLAHAGRKGSVHHPWEGRDIPLTDAQGPWQTIGPTDEPYEPSWPKPKAMDSTDMDAVSDAFVASAMRAADAGFDMIELHMAHGYLLSSFLSPASNRRTDEFGGSLENRLRFPLRIFKAVRAAWPKPKPLAVRISATDWLPENEPGMTPEDAVRITQILGEHGLDLIDVTTAGNVSYSKPIYGRMYQLPFAEKIRYETDVPVMTVGAILGIDHANTILAAERADLVCMARPHLRNPYLTLDGATELGYDDQWWPGPYQAGRTKKR